MLSTLAPSWTLTSLLAKRAARCAMAGLVAFVCQAQTPRFISVGGVGLPVVVKPQFYANCVDAATTLSGREVAAAHIYMKFAAVHDRTNASRRLLTVAVDEQKSYIELPVLTWPTMPQSDLDSLSHLDDALAVHERGHLAIAVAFAEEVTYQQHVLVSADDARAQVAAIVRELNERQARYDAVTSHGVHQSSAPEALRGNDTRFLCR